MCMMMAAGCARVCVHVRVCHAEAITQAEACQARLAYHFSVVESGVPLTYVTNDTWSYGTKPCDGSYTWWVEQAVSPKKPQFCVQCRIISIS